MNRRSLRSPRERVGTLPNADLPPPDPDPDPDPAAAGTGGGGADPACRGAASPDTDSMLRRALMDRDEEAFAAVARGLRPEMLRIATHYVRSSDDAEDVVQETWMAALKAIERFEGRASLRTWLLRILSYTAQTAGRRSARAVPVSQLPSLEATSQDGIPRGHAPLFMPPPRNPADVVLNRELADQIDRCIAALPDRQRDVLVLRDVEGFSGDDVCRALGVTATHQRVLLHRARLRMRGALSEYIAPRVSGRMARASS